MAEGFTESEVEGLLACYEGESSNVRVEQETFETLATVGYDGASMTESDYAALILQAYGLEGEPQTDSYGTAYIVYDMVIQETDVRYFAYFIKTDTSFWTVTFMGFAAEAQASEPDFQLWASSFEGT